VSLFEPGNLPDRNLDLVLTAKGEDEKRCERAKQPDTGHPPDVPDQRKAGDDAKNALTKPIGLFFGISIGVYSRACAA
jgi:hypothetical protein